MSPLPFFVLCSVLLLLPRPSAAQQWGDPSQNATVQVGPLGLTPSFSASSGVDDNVFNDTVDPQSDVTTDARGSVEGFLNAGRTRIIASTQGDYLFFKRYADQRAFGSSTAARFEATLHRVRPFLGGSFTNVRARPSLEIDTRARRRETALRGGVEVRLADKVGVEVAVERLRYAVAEGQVFQQRDLSKALNRTTDRTDVSIRYVYSPLTRFSVTVNSEADRFEAEPSAVARRIRVRPAVDFSPLALVDGHAEVAYMNFRPGVAGVESFSGIVAAVQLNYVLLGRTRFTARVTREPSYSALATSAYFVQTSFGGSVTQVITDRWDVRGSWDRNRLTYRQLPSGAGEVLPGILNAGSIVYSSGGSLGYRFGRNTRLGVNADFNRRVSGLLQGNFENFRVYSAITYGS